MDKYIFGIDLGGTTIKLGLFAENGDLLKKWEIPTRKENEGENILPDIEASLREVMEEYSISTEQVIGAGLGVPGAVLEDRIVKPCVNLNGWGGDVAGQLNGRMGFPCRAVNDANAAALGEMWQGGAKGFENVIMVTLGTGVGSGVIVNGKLLRGDHGAAGEFGHMKVNPAETERCGCGKYGCLEQYASATGIVRTARKLLREEHMPSAMRKLDQVTAKDVFDCAKEGDALAMKVVESFADYLGRALAGVSEVVDPDIFVIGGGVSAAGRIILDTVMEAYKRYAFPASEDTPFALATLGNEAGIRGCARLMIE